MEILRGGMREITKRQFNAFCYVRTPLIRVLVKEVRWFEAGDRKLLGAITFDNSDKYFGFVMLGRDARRIFRCIDCHTCYSTEGEAIDALRERMQCHLVGGQEIYSQGDEKKAPNDIFIPTVPRDKIHDYFKILMDESGYEAARNLIREIVFTHIETDKNYIKEFQTHGFDARLWELYLYVYLYDAGFTLIKGDVSPDYHLSYYGGKCFIEAVTVNPSGSTLRPDPQPPNTSEEIAKLRENYLPIKYGSALFSKLQKKYWELKHVKEKPLIIAIHDFHMPGSMGWSRTALADYLYGVRTREENKADGHKQYCYDMIDNHSWEGKTIPSGFFKQPGSEYVSAVLFSNAATISKFNRMGKLAGLGGENITLIRKGYLFNPDLKAFDPIHFVKNVDDVDYEESWSDSLIMYHNPNALYPVVSGFDNISHLAFDYDRCEYVG